VSADFLYNVTSPIFASIIGNGVACPAGQGGPVRMSRDISHDDPPEAALLQRVSGGDALAFDELYTRWSPMLYGLLCKILADPREAEDALQEGFLHIWRKAGSYDASRSSPTTWAYMIFRNKAIDRIRARERRGKGMERIADEEPAFAPPVADPGEDAENQERREAVKEALGSIPADQREAVTLAFFSGLTQTEIA
jgi:RNA polymerase sigma-70 factor (ECF subfamily)